MTDSTVLTRTIGICSDQTFSVIGVYDINTDILAIVQEDAICHMLDRLEQYYEPLDTDARKNIDAIANAYTIDDRPQFDGSIAITIDHKKVPKPFPTMFWRMEEVSYEMWPFEKGVDKNHARVLEYRKGTT